MSAQPQRSFFCPACQGTVYIPYNLPPTSAPCPHCGSLITSPPLTTAEQATHFTPPPAPVAATTTSKPTIDPVAQASALPKIADKRSDSADAIAERKSSSGPWLVAMFLLLALLGGAYFLYTKILEDKKRPAHGKLSVTTPADKAVEKSIAPDDPSLMQTQYFREGWKKDTAETLRQFIAARTPEEKAKYVIGGRETLARVRKLYGNAIMDELETPADAFLPVPLGDEDIARNIFLMAYDRPAQYAMNRFFRPLASIEVQYEVEQLDPLTQTVTHVSNFSMEPMKIQAFFKKTDKGMLLDWDVYLQTRHRTFKKFFDDPKPGNTAVFRVLIVEDVPLATEKSKQLLVYRVGDPSHMTDSYRVFVPNGSQTAHSLTKINWRGSDAPSPSVSTATVELTVNESMQPFISRLVCWEFEGLGGGASAVDATKGTEKIAKPDSLEDDVHSIDPISE